MAKDLTSRQEVVERETIEGTELPKEETPKEEVVTEETQPESSPEETSEEVVEEKETELDILKKELEKSHAETARTKDAMQNRINELTRDIKSIKEQTESSKERTWDDLNAKEIGQYIAHYTNEGNGEMVAMLTDKLTDKKIAARLDESNSLNRNNAARVQAWNEVASDYPELQDPNSEHYKKTEQFIKDDPRFNDLQRNPEGHAVAARLVAERMLHDKLRNMKGETKAVSKKARDEALKNSLDSSSGKRGETTPVDELDKMMDSASDSRNPYGPEWKAALKKINSAKK